MDCCSTSITNSNLLRYYIDNINVHDKKIQAYTQYIYTFSKLIILCKMGICWMFDLYIDRLLYKILYHCQRQRPVMFGVPL